MGSRDALRMSSTEHWNEAHYWNLRKQQTIVLTKTACQQPGSGYRYSYSNQLYSFQLNFVRIDESEVSMQVSDIDIDY